MRTIEELEAPDLKAEFTLLPLPILWRGEPINPGCPPFQLINDWGDWHSAPCVMAIGNEYGITALVSGDSPDSCYGAWLDEQDTIDNDTMPEAYGFDDFESLHKYQKDNNETPDLIEGYRHQPNATGTGIVCVGHHETQQLLIGRE